MKNLFWIVFFLSTITVAAQKKDTLKLYYLINSDEPDKARLDSFVSTLHNTITEVRIIGYADYLHTTEYNKRLSQRRANKVRNYLVQKARYIEVIESSGKGELSIANEDAPAGEPAHRRVDIIYNPKVFSQTLENAPALTEPKKNKPDSASEKKQITDLNVGESMSIEGLSFIPGEHYLLRESVASLKKLVEALQKNPNLKIEIQGHVCCTKNSEDGLDLSTGERKLSENRAKFIYEYLVGKGISADRLTYKGYGRSRPKAPLERNEAEEQINRRVEIKILEK